MRSVIPWFAAKWAQMSTAKIESYLARIGHSAPPSTDESGLFELHRSHAFSIPFENISPFLGDPVSLQIDALHEKLIQRGRGGYCFEQNGLFSWALCELRFDFQVLLARVQVQNPEPGPLTHQLGIAKVRGREFLCDVGFGGPSIRYPMPFETGRVEIQDSEAFRLTDHPDFGYGLQQRQEDGTWMPLYWFRRQRVLPVDILMGNHFCSTWEKSIFRGHVLCALPFAGGKHTLMSRELKERKDGSLKDSKKLTSGEELVRELRDRFRIPLSDDEAGRLSESFGRLPA